MELHYQPSYEMTTPSGCLCAEPKSTTTGDARLSSTRSETIRTGTSDGRDDDPIAPDEPCIGCCLRKRLCQMKNDAVDTPARWHNSTTVRPEDSRRATNARQKDSRSGSGLLAMI